MIIVCIDILYMYYVPPKYLPGHLDFFASHINIIININYGSFTIIGINGKHKSLFEV